MAEREVDWEQPMLLGFLESLSARHLREFVLLAGKGLDKMPSGRVRCRQTPVEWRRYVTVYRIWTEAVAREEMDGRQKSGDLHSAFAHDGGRGEREDG